MPPMLQQSLDVLTVLERVGGTLGTLVVLWYALRLVLPMLVDKVRNLIDLMKQVRDEVRELVRAVEGLRRDITAILAHMGIDATCDVSLASPDDTDEIDPETRVVKKRK